MGALNTRISIYENKDELYMTTLFFLIDSQGLKNLVEKLPSGSFFLLVKSKIHLIQNNVKIVLKLVLI